MSTRWVASVFIAHCPWTQPSWGYLSSCLNWWSFRPGTHCYPGSSLCLSSGFYSVFWIFLSFWFIFWPYSTSSSSSFIRSQRWYNSRRHCGDRLSTSLSFESFWSHMVHLVLCVWWRLSSQDLHLPPSCRFPSLSPVMDFSCFLYSTVFFFPDLHLDFGSLLGRVHGK